MCRGDSEDYHEGYGSQGPHALPSQEPSSGMDVLEQELGFSVFVSVLSLSLSTRTRFCRFSLSLDHLV